MRLTSQAVLRVSSLLLAGAVAAGCAASPTSPSSLDQTALGPGPARPAGEPAAGLQLQAAAAPSDISGTWNVSGMIQLTLPPLIAEFVLGVTPEGPVTHVRCTFSGTMNLDQVGANFDGSQNRNPNECVTAGGQQVVVPIGPVAVEEGVIRGRSIEFVLLDGPLVCPQNGVVSDIRNGKAYRMTGTARCIVPGHPQSDAPPPFDFDPPPGGTSKVLEWNAWR